jgi:pimeloyl-ACP methyl ester carboxylesterase
MGESQKLVNWLKDADMLQSKIPNARILAFNYDSTWLSDAPRTRVELCGEDLIQSLHGLRQESDRPIIFIAHSFGGLVVQDVSCHAPIYSLYR